MKNTDNRHWLPNEIVEQESVKRSGLIQWWYDQTAIPDPPVSASFAKREAARKSRLVSTIIFWLIVSFALFIPGCFVVPNHYIIYADIGMLVFCVIAIFFNKMQNPQAAGVLLTIGFELALTAIIFTTRPYDEPSIQQYELFVFGELLCLQTQWAPILIRPVAVQLLVAFVCWLWVHSASQAIKRADRAEMVAKLEHELSEQKRELEVGIQQILQTHVEIANGNLKARAPLNQDNALWQIARALNNLLVRLQRANQAEIRLQRVDKAVNVTVQAIQYAEQTNQAPHIFLTQTEIDPLIAALQGKTVASTPVAQQPPRTPDIMQPDASSNFPYYP